MTSSNGAPRFAFVACITELWEDADGQLSEATQVLGVASRPEPAMALIAALPEFVDRPFPKWTEWFAGKRSKDGDELTSVISVRGFHLDGVAYEVRAYPILTIEAMACA